MLRIEDTDRKRLVPESLEKIKESLQLLGLKGDAYHVQSERLSVYEKYLKQLKQKGAIYEDEGAWRFKVAKGKKIAWQDGVHGNVQFASDVIEDFIIMKSDNFPTYHFANIVDDTEMKVTHVLRGDEWLSSTPKHLMLYEALGWKPPIFVHLPIIVGADHKKLSKREGAKSVVDYLDDGYLPEAIINFLALLGWSPKSNQEIFSLSELIYEFSLDRINKNSPIFNLDKLNWFNGQWIRRTGEDDLASLIKKHNPAYSLDQIQKLIPLTRDRIKTLKDFDDMVSFFITPLSPLKAKVSKETTEKLARKLENITLWNNQTIKQTIEETAEEQKIDRIDTIASVRNIVCGREVTPPLYESLEILGRSETIKRLNEYLKNQK